MKLAIGFNPVAWVGHAWRMVRRVDEYLRIERVGDDAPRVLVIITPWQGSAIPWFSLAIGLMLSAHGSRVTFVIDPFHFGNYPIRHAFIVRAITFVVRHVARWTSVIELNATPSAPTSSASIKRLSRLNVVWALRGEIIDAGRDDLEARAQSQLGTAATTIAATVRDADYDLLFVPGGIYGLSGLWVAEARAVCLRVATYDNASYGTWMIAVDGLACHLGDVPRAFEMIRNRCVAAPAEMAIAIGDAEDEVDKRRRGIDAFQSQMTDGGDGGDELAGGVLIALNSSWDAAALGLHVVYPDNMTWIVETVRYLLDTTSVAVVVRQHPAERLPFAFTTDDYRALLDRYFADHPRLYFIAAADPINSYELLARVGSVVVHTSTIGCEAALYGKPVVTGSAAYFAGLGFVWHASDVANYHRLLSAAANGQLLVTDAMRRDATLCFYVTQCCNWVVSLFNPEDFKQWSRVPLATWAAEPATQRMLAALRHNIPVAVLNHDARIAASSNIAA